MNSSSLGAITTPTSGLGMGRRFGLRAPRLGGLGMMKLAEGGSPGHPSMGWLSVRDTLRGMPRHTVPDYMLARMAEGGDPLDYVRRGVRSQRRDIGDMMSAPMARGEPGQMPGMSQRSPRAEYLASSLRDRAMYRPHESQMIPREEDSGDFHVDPSDLMMMLANPRRVPMKAFAGSMMAPESWGDAVGTALSGPMMGGLSAMLHSGNAGAPPRESPRLAEHFDPRVINTPRKYSPFGSAMRRLLGG